MFHLIKSESVPLTRDLAVAFNEMEPSPTEREYSTRRARMLQQAAENRLLLPFHWSQAELNGKLYRMNGQHSSRVLAELEADFFPAEGKVHLDTYKVDDEDDMVLLFRQIDNKYSARSALDISGAFQKLHADLRNVPVENGWLIVRAVSWYRLNMTDTDKEVVPSGDDVGALFNETELHPFILFASALLGDSPSKRQNRELWRIGVVAAMYATYQQDRDEAKAFWETVLQAGMPGVQFDQTDPAYVLEAWLLESRDSENRRKYMGVVTANYFQGCIFAWNAGRSDRAITAIKHDAKRGLMQAA